MACPLRGNSNESSPAPHGQASPGWFLKKSQKAARFCLIASSRPSIRKPECGGNCWGWTHRTNLNGQLLWPFFLNSRRKDWSKKYREVVVNAGGSPKRVIRHWPNRNTTGRSERMGKNASSVSIFRNGIGQNASGFGAN